MYPIHGQFGPLWKTNNTHPKMIQNLKSSDGLIYIRASDSLSTFLSMIPIAGSLWPY